jgi:nitrous oxidase accessory protein NosD
MSEEITLQDGTILTDGMFIDNGQNVYYVWTKGAKWCRVLQLGEKRGDYWDYDIFAESEIAHKHIGDYSPHANDKTADLHKLTLSINTLINDLYDVVADATILEIGTSA